MEEWREIPGFPGYDASSLGRLRTWRHRGIHAARRRTVPVLMRPRAHARTGYLYVTLTPTFKVKVTKTVHSLVCEAFHGPRPGPGHVVRHFPDHTRSNCAADNLSWATQTVNLADRAGHGTLVNGEAHHNCTVPGGNVRVAKMLMHEKVDTQRSIARALGMTPAHLSRIKLGQARVDLAA